MGSCDTTISCGTQVAKSSMFLTSPHGNRYDGVAQLRYETPLLLRNICSLIFIFFVVCVSLFLCNPY